VPGEKPNLSYFYTKTLDGSFVCNPGRIGQKGCLTKKLTTKEIFKSALHLRGRITPFGRKELIKISFLSLCKRVPLRSFMVKFMFILSRALWKYPDGRILINREVYQHPFRNLCERLTNVGRLASP